MAEVRLIVIALFLLPLTALALKIKGFGWTQAFFNKYLLNKTRNPIPQAQQLIMAHNVAKMVSVSANHGPYRANCLKKSLVTGWLLSRRGIQTDLRIGVNKDEGDFNAHSWLEFQGTVLNETADVDKQFSVFDSSKSQKPH